MARDYPKPADPLPPANPMWKRREAWARDRVMVVDAMLLHDLDEHYRVLGIKPAFPNPKPRRRGGHY